VSFREPTREPDVLARAIEGAGGRCFPGQGV
jgi:hypothetical protein